MKTYYFEGSITALEPLTVALKDSVTKSGHRLPRNGGFNSRPYFPATSFRGALRHAGHVAVVKHLAKTNQDPFSVEDHFALAQGIDIKGTVEAVNPGQIDATKALRAKNPFMSLWGRWGVEGHVGVGNLFPVDEDCSAMFGAGARTIMFERNEKLLESLTDTDVMQLNAIIAEQSASAEESNPIKAQIQALKKSLKLISDTEGKKRVFDKIALLDAQLAQIKDAKSESRESIRRPLEGYEAFVENCIFDNRLVLKNANQIELSLFLASFQEFARDPRLGGHQAHNCGMIKGQYTVKSWPEDADAPIEIGTLSWDYQTGFVVEGEELKLALNCWKTDSNIDFKTW